MLTTALQKVKNSVYFYVPQSICRDFGWKPRDRIAIFILRRNMLLITKIESEIPPELARILELYEYKPLHDLEKVEQAKREKIEEKKVEQGEVKG